MKIIVNGADGKTGRVLCEYILSGNSHEIAACVGRSIITDESRRQYAFLTDFEGEADCIIDFSHRSQTDAVCRYAVRRRLPLVIGTTGQNDSDHAIIRSAASFVPVLCSANLSGGIVLFRRLVTIFSAMFSDADIEIVETHHRGKTDVPSGTALMLANAAAAAKKGSTVAVGRCKNGVRRDGEITVHSLRLGDRTGTHEVIMSSSGQTVKLTHESTGRLPYAEGAVRAAVFLYGLQPGLYSEKELYGECGVCYDEKFV